MGDDYKGYVFKITGGNDKQGFTMKQGIMVNGRTRILFKKRKSRFQFLYYLFTLQLFSALFNNTNLVLILFYDLGGTCYRPRRTGRRGRRSVRGCILGPDLAVIMLKVVKKGDKEIEKVTTEQRPNRLGKKRANNIRAAFNLDKQKDDVRKYVIHRPITKNVKDKDGNEKERTFYKAPKIQRLVTEKRVRRKKLIKREKSERYKISKEQ